MPPIPELSGDRQRTAHLIKALSVTGHVDLLVVKDRYAIDPSDEKRLRKQWNLLEVIENPRKKNTCAKTVYWGLALLHPLVSYLRHPHVYSRIKRVVAKGNYDLIVVRYYELAQFCGALSFKIPVALDMDDYEPERWESEASSDQVSRIRRWVLCRKARIVSRHIASHAKDYDLIWGANSSDSLRPGLQRLRALPNIPNLSPDPNRDQSRSFSSETEHPVLLVVSSQNKGNIKGILQFAQYCLPELLRKFPNLKLQVVGNGFEGTRAQELRQRPGVDVLGRVDDLSSLYHECTATIAPVAFGAGTSIKVLESFAYGRPCIMNRFASRGLEDFPRHILDQLNGDTIQGMTEKILGVLDGNPLELGDKCRSWVQQNRAPALSRKAVLEGLRSLKCWVTPRGSIHTRGRK